MGPVVTIEFDLKLFVSVHGVGAGGAVIVQRRPTRSKLLFLREVAALPGLDGG